METRLRILAVAEPETCETNRTVQSKMIDHFDRFVRSTDEVENEQVLRGDVGTTFIQNESEAARAFRAAIEEDRIKSITAAADSMAISAARLSQWLNGKYKGNVEETERHVLNYLELIRERDAAGKEVTQFVFTRGAARIYDCVRNVHVMKIFGVITGGAGYGKSITLRRYANERPDVVYLEVDTTYSAIQLVKKLCVILGLQTTGGLNTCKEAIVDKLRDTGRMIMIDQAEYLPERALDILRTIHDHTKIGILLAGLPQLLVNLRGRNGVSAQIYTRIGAYVEIDKMNVNDVEKLVRAYLPEGVRAGTGKVVNEGKVVNDVLSDLCNRNARALVILIRNARRFARGKEITLEVIEQAARYMVRQ